MSEIIKNYDFENYPRQPLPEMISRRDLLSALVTKIKVESRKNQGQRVLNLSELGNLSDEKLAPLIPMVLENSIISVKDDFVIGQPPGSAISHQLFPVHSPAMTAFDLINGFNTLEQISTRLANETGWANPRCFAYTRGLFLALVVAGLCRPKEG